MRALELESVIPIYVAIFFEPGEPRRAWKFYIKTQTMEEYNNMENPIRKIK
jgi:hypothetical protein